MAPASIVKLEELAQQILQRDGRRVARIVRVELSQTSDPGCILYLEPGGRAMTAWIWTRPEGTKPIWMRPESGKPTVIVERGFQAEPRAFPSWL